MVLSIQNIRKAYGSIQALQDVSFDVPQGSVFGVLGPNGSGKTTLLGILLNVLLPDAGTFSWLGGIPTQDARKRIGALLETPNFYHYLSAWDNLEITAGIRGRGLADRERVLRLVRLWERKDSKFTTYSLGMKQRLAIAAALLGGPDVLVLDEPTNGLDPAGIAEIRTLIKEMAAAGITIIMASHLLDEVEKVCTHVAVLKQGKLLTTGPVGTAMGNEAAAGVEIELKASDAAALQQALSNFAGIRSLKSADGIVVATCEESVLPAALNRHCMEQGVVLGHLRLRSKSLETKFMELTGGQSAADN